MKTLSTEHRRQLERTVVEARDIAEAGARGALEALAVHHHEPYSHMSSEQRKLRNRLRAHARHLGDRVDARSGAHAIGHLVHECAYEHWHGMLFARFLAENHLLIEPEMGVAITLDECEELAKEEGGDKWALAARFAHSMLPQVFRPDHPVFEVQFAREHRLKLEGLVEALAAEVFTATDALGWVYQFWQTRKKEEVNRSEVKIGADELPAVTQLFTEPYMVQFLLHNSLGAWWDRRYPKSECPVELTYLRRADDGQPVAGAFECWPDDLSQFRLLDPCCGSGHFLVVSFLMLVPMRMARESLDPAGAVDAVLRENIHGLELDQRCVTIAAFALALEAWRYPDAGGFRTLPKLNIAWCGQPVAGKKEQWLALAGGNPRLEAGMAALYDSFRDAPILGSLIDPARSVPEDMLTAGFDELQPLLEKALRDHAGEEEWEETAIAALGLKEAMDLLGSHYHLVLTNVPYLGRGRQIERLRKFCEARYANAKKDLANVFVKRCLEFAEPGAGVAQIVTPQNWLFLPSYKALRDDLLTKVQWTFVVRLGARAFETISGEVVSVALLTFRASPPGEHSLITGLDVSSSKNSFEKAAAIVGEGLARIEFSRQIDQFRNPDHVIAFGPTSDHPLLNTIARTSHGQGSFDAPRFELMVWELPAVSGGWVLRQSTTDSSRHFSGCYKVFRWEDGTGQLAELMQAKEREGYTSGKWRAGVSLWGTRGVLVNQMNNLSCSIYLGHSFDENTCVITPNDDRHLPAIWAFCTSKDFEREVRRINQKVNVNTATLAKVPFDLQAWLEIASERYPDGLPTPDSTDPTQWLFNGAPCGSSRPLQVAVARLLGFRWPRQTGCSLIDCSPVGLDDIQSLVDVDGIVCIPSLRGEQPAAERLLRLLHVAYGENWQDSILASFLRESSSASLEDWLRDRFFDEHCSLFQHRPFIWHIWDGRKRDGFHALVNYHKLAEGDGNGRRLLESLTYSYLGDWIARQQDGMKRGEAGAEGRLAAALELQKRLIAILEGEPPFDVFVRWKPIEEQAIGWEPDINDGVRLNIRPFMAQDLPGGKKGAGILRTKPNVHWKKDRGKEPTRDHDQFPWFWKNGQFAGERVNDVHLTNAEKRAAREAATTAANGR